MLTFEFTGVAGSMTVSERLTSGMVGKEIQISLSSDWEELTKTAVFVAGDICRTAELTGTTVIIPEEVMYSPFRKLLVGVCGTDGEGTLVIPTILAEGPFIEPGADPAADPVAAELPVWKNLQNQIGDLTQLNTDTQRSLTAAINELVRSVPVRGEDYWTEDDIAAIKTYVDEAILGGAW